VITTDIPNTIAGCDQDYSTSTVSDQNWNNLETINKSLVDMKYYDLLGNRLNGFSQLKQYVNQFTEVGHSIWKSTGIKLNTIYGDFRTSVMANHTKNKFWAIFGRTAGALIKPSPTMVREFVKFAQADIDTQFQTLPFVPRISMEEYLATRPPEKAKLYRNAYLKSLETGKIPMTLKAEMKSHEMNVLDTNIRPRSLFSPSPEARVWGGYFIYVLLKYIKPIYPQFTHGLNASELADKIYEDCSAKDLLCDSTFVDYDGSQHDSTQHISLIEGIDTYIINKLFNDVLSSSEIPVVLVEQIKFLLTSSQLNFMVQYREKILPKITSKMVEGKIVSTVFSGHPSRTTFGNTMRVIYYLKFILYMARININDVTFWVAGDDVLIRMRSKCVKIFEAVYNRVYYRNGNRKIIYGLGQICKELHITGDHGSFLSKDIILGPTSYVSRLPHRVIAGSNHTHQDIDKQLHSSAVTLGLRDYGILNPFLNRYQQLRDSKFLTTAQLAKARVRADKKRIKKGLYSVNHDNDKDYLDFEAYLTTYMNNALIADLWINHCPVVAASLWKSGAIQPLNNPL